jgi:hypothetical protein
MGNRMINTKFWFDGYIIKLNSLEKLTYLYLLTNHLSSICGIYEIPLCQISHDLNISESNLEQILTKFEADGKMIYRNGWIAIKNFIKHQNLKSPYVQVGIERAMLEVPDEMADWIDLKKLMMPKSIGKEEKRVESWFEELIQLYPNKDGKKLAIRSFKKTVTNEDDYKLCKKALSNYLSSERVANGFIKNASTWFNNWHDWIDRVEPIKPKYTPKQLSTLQGLNNL